MKAWTVWNLFTERSVSVFASTKTAAKEKGREKLGGDFADIRAKRAPSLDRVEELTE